MAIGYLQCQYAVYGTASDGLPHCRHFTDSLAKLTGDEQKAVKTTAFDLQLNPANPGMSFHKLDKARDKNFGSVRVSSDIRLIVHKTAASLLLCYVDHHDKAYDWAERRKLETHPQTGAAQLVEIRETVQEIIVPKYVEAAQYPVPKHPLFAHIATEVLLSYGVPQEWLPDVQQANEDSLLDLADHLPAEAAEALLELATGGNPLVAQPIAQGADPFAHPDAQRRFRVMNDVEELERALEFPWEKWTIFLHPAQRQWVEREYSGPARVCMSCNLAARILPVQSTLLIESASKVDGLKFSAYFLMTEWDEIVDAWQLDSWDAYRDVKRLGRKTRLPEQQRVLLWSVCGNGFVVQLPHVFCSCG